MEITGRFGCAFTAQPATVFEQFSSYAFASLMYDFVAVDSLDQCIDLHTNGSHAKESMRNAFSLFKEKKIVIDAAALSSGGITAEQVLQGYSNPEVANSKLAELDQAHKQAYDADTKLKDLREFIRLKLGVSRDARISIPEEYREDFMEAVRNMQIWADEANRLTTLITLETRGYQVDSGHLVKWSYDNNELLRPLLKDRRIPLSAKSSSETQSRSLSGGTETYAIVLQNLPFPSDLPVDEFVDFRNDKRVRKSIRAFRELADKISNGGVPMAFVLEEMSDQYAEYAEQVHRLRGRRVLANVKFIASNILGFAEDVAKLRFENFGKRPFEIIDYFLDYKDKDKTTETSPFFFIHEKAAD